MFLTWAIGDNQRRTWIGFRFLNRFHRLIQLRPQRNLCNIHVPVHHHTDAKIFTCLALAVFTKFGDGSERCGFRRLSTRIGVALGVQYQNIDVLGQAQDVIQAAKTNIVSPAIAANQPDGFLDQCVGIG